jgi:hypothetical protein
MTISTTVFGEKIQNLNFEELKKQKENIIGENQKKNSKNDKILSQHHLYERVKVRETYFNKATKAYSSRKENISERHKSMQTILQNENQIIDPKNKNNSKNNSKNTPQLNLHLLRDRYNSVQSQRELSFLKNSSPEMIKKVQKSLKFASNLIMPTFSKPKNAKNAKNAKNSDLPPGLINFTETDLDKLLSLAPRPFTTVLTIAAIPAYPPKCTSCFSFHKISEDFGSQSTFRQFSYWNETFQTPISELHVSTPQTIQEFNDPFLVNNPGVVFGFVSLELCRDVFVSNFVQQVPFGIVIPPHYGTTPQQVDVGELYRLHEERQAGQGKTQKATKMSKKMTNLASDNFIFTSLPKYKLTTGGAHVYQVSDYITSLKHMFSQVQIKQIGLEQDNRLKDLLDSIPVVFPFLIIWVLIIALWVFFYFLNVLTNLYILKLLSSILTIIFVSYQFSGPAILKDSKYGYGLIQLEPFIAEFWKNYELFNYNNLSAEFLSICSKNNFNFGLILKLIQFFPSKMIQLLNPILLIFVELTAQFHHWQHTSSRDSYIYEVWAVLGFMLAITLCVVVLIELNGGTYFYQNFPTTNNVDCFNFNDNFVQKIDQSNESNEKNNLQTNQNQVPKMQYQNYGNITLDVDRELQLERLHFTRFNKICYNVIDQNNGVRGDEEKIGKNNEDNTPSTPSTPTNPPYYYRILSRLTTSFIINSLSILTLFALIWFIFGFFIAFEKKHSFMQEAIVIPRRIVNNGIKTSCKYFNIEKACRDGLDKFFWKWFE